MSRAKDAERKCRGYAVLGVPLTEGRGAALAGSANTALTKTNETNKN
jgi:hypothetical protein